MVDRNSSLWSYLQPELKELITDGEIIAEFIKKNKLSDQVTDFSFLVFPFAKAYEGFLKKLFLDLDVIHYDDYYGDEIRIGRLLNPHYQGEIGHAFEKLCNHSPGGKKTSDKLWEVWKQGRNLIFHYFPHNFKRLTFDEALSVIGQITEAMEFAVLSCNLSTIKGK
jgi:hypothetical protein